MLNRLFYGKGRSTWYGNKLANLYQERDLEGHTTMKKILIIGNHSPSHGGISGQIDILLQKHNNEKLNSDLFNTKVNRLAKCFLPIKLLLVGSKYNFFHIHGCSFLGFYPIIIGILVGKLLNKKIIVTYHGGNLSEFIRSYKLLCKWFLSKADLVTVPSKFLYDLIVFHKLNNNTIILPNVIETNNVYFKVRDQITPKLIVTRNFENIYNIPIAIKAYSIIKKKYSNASLRLVGDGTISNQLKNEVRSKNLKNVIFTGRVSNSEIGRELNKADIFINPTTQDSFSVSTFEAFACGLPVISTNVGAIPNYVKNQHNGFLVESGDASSIANKISYILENQHKIKAITSNAYQTFKQYTWENLKFQYAQIYEAT